MPVYEYYCDTCRKRFNFLVRSIADHKPPSCPKCGKKKLERRFSAFATPKGEERRATELAESLESSGLENLDDSNPQDLARFMRKMGDDLGEDLGDEFDEVCGRLERGEDPEAIDASLGLSQGGGAESTDGGLYEA